MQRALEANVRLLALAPPSRPVAELACAAFLEWAARLPLSSLKLATSDLATHLALALAHVDVRVRATAVELVGLLRATDVLTTALGAAWHEAASTVGAPPAVAHAAACAALRLPRGDAIALLGGVKGAERGDAAARAARLVLRRAGAGEGRYARAQLETLAWLLDGSAAVRAVLRRATADMDADGGALVALSGAPGASASALREAGLGRALAGALSIGAAGALDSLAQLAASGRICALAPVARGAARCACVRACARAWAAAAREGGVGEAAALGALAPALGAVCCAPLARRAHARLTARLVPPSADSLEAALALRRLHAATRLRGRRVPLAAARAACVAIIAAPGSSERLRRAAVALSAKLGHGPRARRRCGPAEHGVAADDDSRMAPLALELFFGAEANPLYALDECT